MATSDEVQEQETVENKRDGFRKRTSSRGVVAWFRPFPPFMREMIGEQMEVDGHIKKEPPTYEAETFGGDIEIHEHDETTIVGDPLAEAEWLDYLEENKAWETEYNQRLFKLSMIRCMEVEGLDNDDWVKGQEFLGVEVPEEPLERKIHYIKTEYIGNNEDYLSILQVPFELALAPSELQAAAERMFRKLVVEKDDTTEGSGSDTGEEELDVAGEGATGGSDVPETGDST